MASKIIIQIVFFQIVMANAGHVTAQSKFEFGIRFDPLTIPVNFGTFTEDGPGYYDIKAKGKITQAVYLDFTYWPLQHWGISLGAGVHSFHSEIEYFIPDPSNLVPHDTAFYRHDHIKAVGLGPHIALQYRNQRFRTRVAYSIFDYSKQEFPVRSGYFGTTIFDDTGVLAEVEIEEESFWNGYFTEGNIWQLDVSYEIVSNLFVKMGFESSLTNKKYYPYTTKITGFTYETTPENQLLNDFKMSNAYSAFSLGVEYVIGFGKYGKDKNIEDNAD